MPDADRIDRRNNKFRVIVIYRFIVNLIDKLTNLMTKWNLKRFRCSFDCDCLTQKEISPEIRFVFMECAT